MKRNKYRNLTPLKALELLLRVESSGEKMRNAQLGGLACDLGRALQEHVQAAIVRGQRR